VTAAVDTVSAETADNVHTDTEAGDRPLVWELRSGAPLLKPDASDPDRGLRAPLSEWSNNPADYFQDGGSDNKFTSSQVQGSHGATMRASASFSSLATEGQTPVDGTSSSNGGIRRNHSFAKTLHRIFEEADIAQGPKSKDEGGAAERKAIAPMTAQEELDLMARMNRETSDDVPLRTSQIHTSDIVTSLGTVLQSQSSSNDVARTGRSTPDPSRLESGQLGTTALALSVETGVLQEGPSDFDTEEEEEIAPTPTIARESPLSALHRGDGKSMGGDAGYSMSPRKRAVYLQMATGARIRAVPSVPLHAGENVPMGVSESVNASPTRQFSQYSHLGKDKIHRGTSALSAPPSPDRAGASPAGPEAEAGPAPPRRLISSEHGIPVHETLHPRQAEYWNFDVQDHALDVMAFVRQIRIIKATERATREAAGRREERIRKKWSAKIGRSGTEVQSALLSEFRASRNVSLVDGASMNEVAEAFLRSTTNTASPTVVLAQQEEVVNNQGAAQPMSTSAFTNETASVISGRDDADWASSASMYGVSPHRAGGASHITVAARVVDATSVDADDCSIVYVAHSMGGCIGIMYTLLCRALLRPHWLSKLVLLSPAGMHRILAFPLRVALRVLYHSGFVDKEKPFPLQNSKLQRFVAQFMQDLKQYQGTTDLFSVIGSRFFGGPPSRFVFKHVSFCQYPIGGTSAKVIRMGAQNVFAGDFQCYDYGKKENRHRYGTDNPASYRHEYGLLDIPVHFVAGANDSLVPPEGIEEQVLLINMIHGCAAKGATVPGKSSANGNGKGAVASLREFTDAGHLDFTLTLHDDIIDHVLRHLFPDYCEREEKPRSEERGATVDTEEGCILRNPRRLRKDSPRLERLRQLAAAATERVQRDEAVTAGSPPTPYAASACSARRRALLHPILYGFTKLHVVLNALDEESKEMGL
jgi:pimeloyl-ACP methyl ester carboxylesterase